MKGTRKKNAQICTTKYNSTVRETRRIEYKERKQNVHCPFSLEFINKYFPEKGLSTYDEFDEYSGSGLDYNGSKDIFKIGNRTFESTLYNSNRHSTYIYIISKTVGSGLYFKVGEGGKSDGRNEGTKSVPGRLGDAQTFLIPGLQNAGYKVHYVFYFLKETHPNLKDKNTLIGMHIEQKIHQVLRIMFAQATLHFPTSYSSEWYKIEKTEVKFFLGFIFDIITLFNSPILTPLKIWKYSLINKETPSPNDTKKDIELPTVSSAERRMSLFIAENETLTEIKKAKERLRNKAIDMRTIAVLANPQEKLVDLVKEEYKANEKPIYSIENLDFNLYSIRRPETRDTESKREFHITYVGLQIEKNKKDVETIIKRNIKDGQEDPFLEIVQSADPDKVIYYIKLKNFLYMESKKLSVEEYKNWVLKDSYENLEEIDSEDSIEQEIEQNTSKILKPSFYFETAVQDYYGEKFAKDNGYVYDDYSTGDYEKQVKKTWKIIQYDKEKKTVLRQLIDSDTQDVVDDMYETVPINDVMDVENISEVKRTKKTKNQWTKARYQVFEVNDTKYRPKDIIKLRQDVFTHFIGNIPDGEVHKDWKEYYIDSIWDDKNSTELLNPYVDVIDMIEFEKQDRKPSKCSKLYFSTKFLDGKIEMIEQAEYTEYKNKYNTGTIFKINNSHKFVWNAFAAEHNLHKSWKDAPYHYIEVNKVSISDFNYRLQLLKPFQNNEILVDMKKTDDTLTKIDVKDNNSFIAYKKEIPHFMGYTIEKIKGHYPNDYIYTKHNKFVDDKKKLAEYVVEWSKGPVDIYERQIPELVWKYAKSKVEEYQKEKEQPTKRKGVKSAKVREGQQQSVRRTKRIRPVVADRYLIPENTPGIDSKEDDERIQKLGENNWNHIRTESLKKLKKNKPPLQKQIRNKPRETFYIGDEFWTTDTRGNLLLVYITAYFYDEDKKLVFALTQSRASTETDTDVDFVKATDAFTDQLYEKEIVNLYLDKSKEAEGYLTWKYLRDLNKDYNKAYSKIVERYKRITNRYINRKIKKTKMKL